MTPNDAWASRARPRRRPRELAVLALLLHGAVVWMMCSSRWTSLPQRSAERISWMTLPAAETPRLLAPPVPLPTPRASRPPDARTLPPPQDTGATPEDAGAIAGPSAGDTASRPTPPTSPTPPLGLDLPPGRPDPAAPLTPAQEALRDPRSNTLALTREERLLLISGVVECIAWRRMPDGSIYRGPGHARPVPGIPARTDGSHVMECVP